MTDLEIATEMTTEFLKDQGNAFIVGNRYKITGGKYKKYKFCNLVKINDTYSDVCIESSENKPGTESPFNTIHSKVKNCYLYPEKNPVIIEMPDASDLQVVSKLLPEHEPEVVDVCAGILSEAMDKLFDTPVEPPTMTEALANREELIKLRKENDEWKVAYINHTGENYDKWKEEQENTAITLLKQENDELKDSCIKYVTEIGELSNANVYANAQAILDDTSSSSSNEEEDVIHNLALTIASLNKELDEYKAMIYGINKLLKI
tara:strand:+ start:155 stop:943 length:789 start_codon:yes stop_codon:yes gene_type:complete